MFSSQFWVFLTASTKTPGDVNQDLARIVGGNPLEQQMAAMLDLLKCPRCSRCRVPITGHSSLGVRHGAAGWVKGLFLVSLAEVRSMHLVPRLCTGSI